MNLNSIKWRLQLWYLLVLVAVLVGFGATAYQLERNRVYRRVDDEIHRRIGALAQQLHGPPRGRLQRPPPGDFPPPPEFPDEDMPGRNFQPPKFNLTPRIAALFDTNAPDIFYFVLTGRNGNVIASSEIQPPGAPPAADSGPRANDAADGPKPSAVRTVNSRRFGDWQEFFESLPSGETIRVGCSIAREQRDLRIHAFFLTSVGGGVLLLGLAGGWFFVGRSLRPITEISSTAVKISSGDLSQRINMAETESELGQLGAVLNSTFARLETAFAQQKQFASDAAHELRTPVTVMLTQTQMTLGRERDAAAYKQTVEACQRAAQRMRKLIESLLELARFDAGQEVLKRLNFDLAKIVAECVEMIQPLAEERRVKILPELEPLEITADSERLGQVVTNLLTNAIQYNKPDGEVRVKLTGQGGLAVLEITDTGKGISAENLPRVFERFFRADKSRTGAGNSGLGLSICKAIVEAHGGTIGAASQENLGTSFVVRLPLGIQ